MVPAYRKSIKLQVFAILATATAVITVLFTLLAITIAYVIEDESIEKLLQLEAQHIETAYKKNSVIINPRLDFITLYKNTLDAPETVIRALEDSPNRHEVFTKDNSHYHIQDLSLGDNSHSILVAEVSQLLTVSNASNSIVVLFFLVFMAALGVGVWAAYRIAVQVTRPITQLAEGIEKAKRENIEFTTSEVLRTDEVAYLADTIETALARLNETLLREKDFNRDLSHELRTPLTIMNNTLTLAEDRPLTQSDVGILRNSVQSINQSLVALLALAREESFSAQVISLRALIEEVALDLYEEYKMKEFSVNIDVNESYTIQCNHHLLIILLRNLIKNAFTHSGSSELNISLDTSSSIEARLIFENKIVSSSLNEPTKSKGEANLGIGLYLVRRIVETLGWRYRVYTEEDKYQFLLLITS